MNKINNTECITEDSVPVCKANVILSPATEVYTCIVKCKKGDGTHSACECYFYDSK